MRSSNSNAGLQQKLDVGSAGHKPTGAEDYINLFPERVLPTKIDGALECKGDLLLIKRYPHRRKIAHAHHRLFLTMTKLGEHPEAPGNVTVFCVWGSNVTAHRELVVYEQGGVADLELLTNEEYRQRLSTWWWSRDPSPGRGRR